MFGLAIHIFNANKTEFHSYLLVQMISFFEFWLLLCTTITKG